MWYSLSLTDRFPWQLHTKIASLKLFHFQGLGAVKYRHSKMLRYQFSLRKLDTICQRFYLQWDTHIGKWLELSTFNAIDDGCSQMMSLEPWGLPLDRWSGLKSLPSPVRNIIVSTKRNQMISWRRISGSH